MADASQDGVTAIAIQTGTTATLVRYDALGGRAPDVVLASSVANLLVQPHFVRVDANGETTIGVHESSPFANPSLSVAAVMKIDGAGQVIWRQEAAAFYVRFDGAGQGRVVAALDSPGAGLPRSM